MAALTVPVPALTDGFNVPKYERTEAVGKCAPLPASMSRKPPKGKLWGKLGYQGVTITDAMAMGAIAETSSSGESAVMTILFGVDIVRMPQDLVSACQSVCAAVKDGTVSQKRLDQSVLRIPMPKASLAASQE